MAEDTNESGRIAELEAALKEIFEAAYTEESMRLRGWAVEGLLGRIGDIARNALEAA